MSSKLTGTPLFQNEFISVFHVPTESGYLYTVVQPRDGVGASIMPIIPPSENHPESRLLVLSQHRPPVDGLSWEFPAGAVDLGEGAHEGAARELQEETTIEVSAVDLKDLGYFNNAPQFARDTVHLYAAMLPVDYDAESVVPQDGEIVGYRWYSLSELMEKAIIDPAFCISILPSILKARQAGLLEAISL